jgi:hypothetical protein
MRRNSRGEKIDKIDSRFKSKMPETTRKGRLDKKSEPGFHNMTMTMFDNAVLLTHMWA